MCYSAQIKSSYAKYVRKWGAEISIRDFYRLYWLRSEGEKIRIPRAIDTWFASPASDDERQIRDLIERWNASESSRLEAELFAQKQRLNKAERALAEKPTKKAAEDKRIATSKIDAAITKLALLRSAELAPDDSRIFPAWYAPVVVIDDGRKVIKPMRYQCRPAGAPAFHDTKFPGTYNARRDNLNGYWKGLFGRTHGVLIANCFYENVQRDGKNAVLEFEPQTGQDMFVACLWSRWTDATGELLSFAAITDDPPAEISEVGHDRCIIPIREDNIDAWLNPDPANLAASSAILDDRERPYYEHRIAA